jgi:hypothetical protein
MARRLLEDGYMNLRCSACLAVGAELYRKLNATALDTTFQATHRLSKQNKITRVTYRGSELQAIEILEELCTDLKHDCRLRTGSDGQRLFSKNTTYPQAEYYSKADREDLDHVSGTACKDICQEIFADYEDKLIKVVRAHYESTLEVLNTKLCNDTVKMCNKPACAKHSEKEENRRKKWQNRKDAEEKKRKDDEEKRRLEQEEKERKRLEDEEKIANEANQPDSAPPPPPGEGIEQPPVEPSNDEV